MTGWPTMKTTRLKCLMPGADLDTATNDDVRAEQDCDSWERRRLVGRLKLSVATQRAGGTPALPGGGRMGGETKAKRQLCPTIIGCVVFCCCVCALRAKLLHQLVQSCRWRWHERGRHVSSQRHHRPARCRRADDQRPVFPHRRILERHYRRPDARRAAAHDHLQLSTLNRDRLVAVFGNRFCFAAELRLEHGELDKHRVVDNDQRHDQERYHQSAGWEFVFPA